ncbi:unnamed protein product [Kuraishia capsulata CBS 1993]|uniref:Vacuolar protein sorting-associated protein 27 n=1 Tax=Kuraishia capsulata CBS 1993 TaxID=1382522 RepID=W6MUX4_9ASCO|nr:uncharacterized protein KUCA_T00005610001 [Kuraishia capsulata CBS 1993]CDK29617.1 unnamed protein product [Kuraishia capsulata CBS 1993]
MSWFGGASVPNIDEKIAEATAESIAFGEIDLAAALEVSDLIRSKAVPARDAMRALKKRFMTNKNPNTQKSALKLIDFCIKNGGEHFVVEVSSKEFCDPLAAYLHDRHINPEVKSQLLESIQSWSVMFSTNSRLNYVTSVYKKLTDEGTFDFPEISSVADPAFIESRVAPEWMESDACMQCSTLFSFVNRRHHCRSCGGAFCGTHSSKSCQLPELGITIPVRVCDSCYEEHKEKTKSSKGHARSDSTKKVGLADDDDDLRRAIELSLREAGNPQEAPSAVEPVKSVVDDYEEDEDMKAAIAASLQDMRLGSVSEAVPVSSVPALTSVQPKVPGLYDNLLPQASSFIPTNQDSYRSPLSVTPSVPSSVLPQPAYQHTPLYQPPLSQEDVEYQEAVSDDLSHTEKVNILLFSQLVSRMHDSGSATVDPSVENLSNSVAGLRPKLSKALADSASKQQKFLEMYGKLDAIMTAYDRLLDIRLQNVYRRNAPAYPISAQTDGVSSPALHYPQPQYSQQAQYAKPQQTYSQPPIPQQFSGSSLPQQVVEQNYPAYPLGAPSQGSVGAPSDPFTVYQPHPDSHPSVSPYQQQSSQDYSQYPPAPEATSPISERKQSLQYPSIPPEASSYQPTAYQEPPKPVHKEEELLIEL